jgi:acyl-homoserine-lactone acylase
MVSVQNAMQYATDTQVPYAIKAIRALPRRSTGDSSAQYAEAVGLFRSWNGRADIDAHGCALYLYWMLADNNNSALAQKASEGIKWTPAETAAAVASLVSAAGAMKTRYGKLDVPWGEVHVSHRGDKVVPVSGLGYFLPGDKTASVTPNFGPMVNGKINCDGGSSFRMIVELDPKGIRSWSILPYGVSQDPANPHYADQMELFGSGKYKDTLFGLNRIKKEATSSEKLTVGQ